MGEIVLSSYSGKKQKEPDWKQAVKDMRKKAYESETAQASDKTPGYIARFNQMIRDLGEGSLAKGYLKASLTGWKMIGKETMSDIKKEIGFTREGLTKSFEGLSYIAKKGVKLGKTVDDVFERGVKIKIENKGLENLLRRFSRSDGTSELEEESLEEVEDTIKPAGLVSRTYQRTQEIGRGLMETSAGYRDRLKTMGNGSYLKGLNEVRKSVQEIIGESLQSGGQRLKGMGDGSYLKGSLELGRQIYLNIKESRTSIEEPFTEEWTEKQEKEWEDLAGRMDRGEKLRLKERNRLVNLDGNREYILEKKTEEEGESEREANEPSLEEKVVNDGLDALRNYIPDDESLGDFQRGERSQKEMPGKTRLGKIPQMEILNQGEIDALLEPNEGNEDLEGRVIPSEKVSFKRTLESEYKHFDGDPELDELFRIGAERKFTTEEKKRFNELRKIESLGNDITPKDPDYLARTMNNDAYENAGREDSAPKDVGSLRGSELSEKLNEMMREEFKDDNYTTGESDEPTLSEEEFKEDMARLTPEEREEWDGLRRIDPWDMNDRQFNRYSELVEKKNDRQNST
ncbi:MAG: hypothetical protein KJ905_02785 [Nanoarchaeota archaeon]|nr:hypothetical protein [Nanoarchaeota archaeon]